MTPESTETTLLTEMEPPALAGGKPDQGEPIPAYMTWALALAWVGVYLAMLLAQGRFDFKFGTLGPGQVDSGIAHEFGSMTARDVARGEVWRTITATFIHFSLLHLICNLSCLIPMGRVLESWYGAAQFLCIYLVLGAAGNGLAVAGRYALHGSLDAPCAGGSSVMFGFVAMMAVVGWRSRTRFGDFLKKRMLAVLIIFGLVMGVIGRKVLDNYGHGGGAIAGAAVGFLHRTLIRVWDRKRMILASAITAAIVLVACVAGQWQSGRREADARHRTELARKQVLLRVMADGFDRVTANHEVMARIIEKARGPFRTDPTAPMRREMRAGIVEINLAKELGPPGGDSAAYARWRQLAESAARKQPGPGDIGEFRKLTQALRDPVRKQVRDGLNAARPGR